MLQVDILFSSLKWFLCVCEILNLKWLVWRSCDIGWGCLYSIVGQPFCTTTLWCEDWVFVFYDGSYGDPIWTRWQYHILRLWRGEVIFSKTTWKKKEIKASGVKIFT